MKYTKEASEIEVEFLCDLQRRFQRQVRLNALVRAGAREPIIEEDVLKVVQSWVEVLSKRWP